MISRLYLYGGAVAAALAAFGLVYGVGYVKGRTAGRVAQLQDTVEAYKQRQEIDEDVANLDDYRLCLDIGGLREQCEQLRGVDEAASGE